ncbi:MAG: DUF3999 domain-containing protein [Deltaproteobacteria bacterium]|nr:DUF3999 domain-containing protein [Deltaproteobacteria bacterium]
MKKLGVLVLSVLLGSSALAAPPVPDDFAFGLIVETPGAEALYSLTVPEEVYRRIWRADLGDMRMFNARGETVPHMLRRSHREEILKTQGAPPAALPFFPVYETALQDSTATAITVATNEKGVVVDVKSADGSAPGARIAAYIIDASELKHRPAGLRIDWSDEAAGFTVSVDVEASADLNRWHELVRNSTLMKLDFGGQQLSRQVIDLPWVEARYLRLTWPPEARDARVTSVQALFPDEFSINRRARQWTEIEGRAVRDETSGWDYEYDSNAMFSVDAVNLRLPERNSLVQSAVMSRHDESAAWRRRAHGVFYSLMHDGTLLENNPVPVGEGPDRFWRIWAGLRSGIGKAVPVLQLGWIPHDLVFVARGEGPFTLAYGSAVVGRAEQPLDAMLARLEKRAGGSLVKEARVTQAVVLGGEKCFRAPKPPLPWKTWILWAVLVAAAGVLGVMAWRLFRQMDAHGKDA